MTGNEVGLPDSSEPEAVEMRGRRRFDLVDSALFAEVIFGGVVVMMLWLVLMAVYGMVAFVLAVLVAVGAGMWATGLSLYATRSHRD